MIGVVLAAGTGRRLRPHTDGLPKALVPLGTPPDRTGGADEPLTPLDVILANFAAVGVTDIAVIVGYAADAVYQRRATLERRYGVTLDLVDNDRAETWNNCYSLWCARERFTGADVLLSNGDTVHPVSVEHALLGAPPGSPLLLAVDTTKDLGDEEMKVASTDGRSITRITKLMAPSQAYGEYIGVAAFDACVGEALTDALHATWQRDPGLYYEDGFQELVDRGEFRIDVQPIGAVPWIEIDDTDDLSRATEVLDEIAKTTPGSGADREHQCPS